MQSFSDKRPTMSAAYPAMALSTSIVNNTLDQGPSKYLLCDAFVHRCIQSGSDIIAGAVTLRRQ
jgi:hypothetical protein